MNAAQRSVPPVSGRRPIASASPASSSSRELAGVRSQAAFVRALLDEVERVTTAGARAALDAQLVEELARLGCRFLEVASALAEPVGADAPTRCA